MIRLFVGLRPPPVMRCALLALMGGISGARWQGDDQLHLTLRYIGEVSHPQAEDAAAMLGTIRAAPIELSLSGVGRFEDKRGRVNAVWAGVTPHDAVTRLHQKINHALTRAGLAPERRAYLPHITLARMSVFAAATDRFLADHSGLTSPPAQIEHISLFQSHLGSEAALYETIARFPLID